MTEGGNDKAHGERVGARSPHDGIKPQRCARGAKHRASQLKRGRRQPLLDRPRATRARVPHRRLRRMDPAVPMTLPPRGVRPTHSVTHHNDLATGRRIAPLPCATPHLLPYAHSSLPSTQAPSPTSSHSGAPAATLPFYAPAPNPPHQTTGAHRGPPPPPRQPPPGASRRCGRGAPAPAPPPRPTVTAGR